MKKLFIIFLSLFVWIQSTSAINRIEKPNGSISETEYGVQCIQRICPTVMWDSWTFRDIMYDKDSKTVLFVIQLKNWQTKECANNPSNEDVKKQAEWIVSNLKAAYCDLTSSSDVLCDGDFMLYLSLGQLLKNMENEGAGLRIMLLKPDYQNQVVGDIPMILSSEQIKEVQRK